MSFLRLQVFKTLISKFLTRNLHFKTFLRAKIIDSDARNADQSELLNTICSKLVFKFFFANSFGQVILVHVQGL